MPSAERTHRGGARLLSALAAGLAVCAALLPSLRVVEEGPWLPGGLILTALILGASTLVRAVGGPAPLGSLVGAVVGVVGVTVVFFRDSAWWGLIPSPDTVGFAVTLVREAVDEMTTGIAPLPATVPVSFFFVAATAGLAVVLDYVVIATRLPLLASVALLAVGLAPAIAVPGRREIGTLVFLAAAILLLLWVEGPTRRGAGRRVWTGSSAGALAVGAIAVVVAVVATPLLPPPLERLPVGAGGGSIGIDASLRLGDDLRRPDAVDVLEVRSSAGSAPYLRAATLSGFDGRRWRPDSAALLPVADGFAPVDAADDVSQLEVDTHIEVSSLRAQYLPVPFAATAVTGLEGDWGLQAENRTVIALDADSAGQVVDVTSTLVRPSLDQIRGASSRGADVATRYLGIPDETPASIAALAQEVTAGAATDYDALAALQRWFRSNEFGYSLTAPVADDFDGAGVQAIEQFLTVREGYCVHYASAFALMSRTLGMPSRIVVGYLPGTATGEVVDGQSVYAVTSNLLHAWPEVYFEGIGWVGFEPTNSLGAPPRFTTTAANADADTPAADAPSAAPSASPSSGRPLEDIPDAAPDASAQSPIVRAWTGAGGVTLVVLVVLAAPGVAGLLRRRRRMRAGEAAASWLSVQETAIDLGIAVPGSASPRALGQRLTAAGADPEAVRRLVGAVEHAAYAPPGTPADAATDAASAVRASLLAAASPARRLRALVLPWSLVVRPGTALAAHAD